ncbi:A-kinase anchor protein 12 [Hippocampus zosterae]|uniref:A-kinase anchor protein 12 n=1 Tax=Hippocampus zosterae TaxID=109293 RepID=UPI00223DAB31|nr:A-kinase anchor protein 12 [Hippocampus zosterae]
MAATEAGAAPALQEDGDNPESKQTQAEEPAQKSETGDSEAADKDGALVNSEVIPTKDGVHHDAPVEAAASGNEEAAVVGGEAQAARVSETHEHKTSFLDSFLNKSGLGKVMPGRKKKEPSAGSEESAADKDRETGADEPPAAAEGAEAKGVGEAEAAADEAPENGDKEDEKKAKESKASVRDLIRKPVAKIFSHRGTEKKDADAPEAPKPVKVRSKSLDRLEDAEALRAAADEAAAEAETEADPKASSSSSAAAKHMKRWHSFKKLMAQKAHKRGGGEDGGGDAEGGGDSSTLDSKDSGQKRWKLKRSWTFQGLKRDPSLAGIAGKAKEERDAEPGADEEDQAEEKAEEAGEAGGGAAVTQHANDIWTSFKKRVIPKSKRANAECGPAGDRDAVPPSGEDGAAEDAKDAKSARAKRPHFGRAVSLKNFILRKGKSASVDAGDAAKEDEEAAAQAADGQGDLRGDGKVHVEAAGGESADDRDARRQEGRPEVQTAPAPAQPPVTNGDNGCQNGTAEDHGRDGPELDDENRRGPVAKSKELAAAKEEPNAKVLNATAPPVNSEQKAGSA